MTSLLVLAADVYTGVVIRGLGTWRKEQFSRSHAI